MPSTPFLEKKRFWGGENYIVKFILKCSKSSEKEDQ